MTNEQEDIMQRAKRIWGTWNCCPVCGMVIKCDCYPGYYTTRWQFELKKLSEI